MKFKFEKLTIWQNAMEFGENIPHLVLKFPNYEMFGLSSQSRKASDSIALNIAEGSIDQSNLEQKRFMSYSIRSLAEVVTCLHKAKRRNYITEEEFRLRYEEAFNLMNMMVSFKRNIK
ncbi:four helix bundle protein [Aquiflexum sp.]|uniref:four helix bundle protein n=1 Tax=Aquiflexum sp. TaxID=1872584 RepID=UPI0035943BF7